MIFMGTARQGDSPYFEDKLSKARNKLSEFPTISSVVDSFNLANRENHTENFFINLLSASVSDAFLDGKPNERYDKILREFEETLKELLPKLSRNKKNNLVVRLKSFGDNHRETINEIEFLIELKQNPHLANIEYENEILGNHDFSLDIEGEKFNIEQTCLGKNQIQKMVEEAFDLASKEIIERIPKKILLKIDIDTKKILRDKDNSVEEIKDIVMQDYYNLEKVILVDLNGSCRVENRNIGDHNKKLYDVRDIYEYYDEFGQRLTKLTGDEEGITYLKDKKIGEIVDCSITHFMIFPAKFGSVGINSQCMWPSKAESLRKESLIKQLKRRIKEKINSGQLSYKINPIIAIRFEDFIFMHYSSEDDVWWQENFNELKNIVEEVFREIGNDEILGILLYENTIKKSTFIKNPNKEISDILLNKINLLKK